MVTPSRHPLKNESYSTFVFFLILSELEWMGHIFLDIFLFPE